MIIWNVQRRWFPLKGEAEAYRKAQGLKPGATIKVSVDRHADLVSLLNGLCEPSLVETSKAVAKVLPTKVVDEAYVEPEFDIPAFLLKDHPRPEPKKGSIFD